MLIRWFPLPRTPEALVARYAVLLTSCLFWLWGWLVALTLAPPHDIRWSVCVAGGAVALFALLLGRWHSWRLAAWWLALAMGAAWCVLGWVAGTAAAIVLLGLVVAVVFAGAALGIRAAWVIAACAQLLVSGLWWRGTIHIQEWLAMAFCLGFLLLVGTRVQWRHLRYVTRMQRHLQHLKAQRAQLDLLHQAIEQSPDVISIVDLQGRLAYVNQAFEAQTGYARNEVLGRYSREVSATGLSAQDRHHMRETTASGHVWRSILHNRRRDDSVVVESVSISPVHNSQGRLTHFIENRHDLSERLEAEQRILKLQNFDTVTQLPNRFAIKRRLDSLLLRQRMQRVTDTGSPMDWHGLLLVDLDRFRKFNDARGAAWGDALLQAMALQLSQLLPEDAWLGRHTSDQFCVIVEHAGIDRQTARQYTQSVAEQLQSGLRELVCVLDTGEEHIPVSTGIGYTVFPFTEPGIQTDSSDHVMRRAHVALHHAKLRGAGQIHAYSEALADSAARSLQIERDLHVALQRGELQLFVQPQVDMEGRVRSVEALVRWQHPQEGMVSPGTFIPIAEDAGLIVPLGDWVLEQACAMLADARVVAGRYGVSVNVSALQFEQPNFVDKLAALLQRTGIDPSRLTLEMTESLLLKDVELTIRTMEGIRALGVEFALDDFGTGYSSLAYLMRLPIQEIKMDQSFVRALDPNTVGGALVEALLMVAKRKGLRVVAEGVEHAHQAELLQAWEPAILCQGYLFSKPLLAEAWMQAPQQLAPRPAVSEDRAG